MFTVVTSLVARSYIARNFKQDELVVTWRDRREGPSSILRLGPSYTIAEFNRRVNLRFCIDHRIAMAKKWRVKGSEWILAGVFKKMRCDLFCFLFFSSKILCDYLCDANIDHRAHCQLIAKLDQQLLWIEFSTNSVELQTTKERFKTYLNSTRGKR